MTYLNSGKARSRKNLSPATRRLLLAQGSACACGTALNASNLIEWEARLICGTCNLKRLGLIP